MTKYSTPSIEVVSFNPSDAPRIGMQWWVNTGSGYYTDGYAALGQNWTPTNPDRFYLRYQQSNGYAGFPGLVDVYQCHDENITGALIWGDNNDINIVIDDGASC